MYKGYPKLDENSQKPTQIHTHGWKDMGKEK